MVLCILGTASFILCHIYQTTMDGFAFFTFVSVSQFDFVIRMYIETRYLSRRVRNTEWDQQQHRIRLCSNSGWYNGFLALPRLHIWIEENVPIFRPFSCSLDFPFVFLLLSSDGTVSRRKLFFFFSADTLVCVCLPSSHPAHLFAIVKAYAVPIILFVHQFICFDGLFSFFAWLVYTHTHVCIFIYIYIESTSIDFVEAIVERHCSLLHHLISRSFARPMLTPTGIAL